jgi:phosphatidate cytidylyltransferase
MLSTRLVIGFSMIGLLLTVLCLDEYLAPWFPFWFVLALLAMASSSLELVGLMQQTNIRPSGSTVLGGAVALVLANWAPHIFALSYPLSHEQSQLYDPMAPVSDLSWPLLTFVGVVMLTFVVQSLQFQRPGTTVATIGGTVLALAYVGLLGTFIIQIRWFDGKYHGLVPLVYMISTAKGADTGAYSIGRLAGRHKLWPQISPNKTIEGSIGGLVAGVVAALIVEAIFHYLFRIPTLGWNAAAGFGLVVGSVAQLGDLMESMIKRDCERKDASDAVPGFGGVLDVLDSLLFAGPVAYAYWLLFGP